MKKRTLALALALLLCAGFTLAETGESSAGQHLEYDHRHSFALAEASANSADPEAGMDGVESRAGMRSASPEAEFYTNKTDLYYHADPDCDRPPAVAWHGVGGVREIYAREIYSKVPISAEAAEAFGKAACPVCVKEFEPVYLGEHMPAWTDEEYTPWGAGMPGEEVRWDGSPAPTQWGTPEYRAEIGDTYDRFEAYFEEVYDRETDSYARRRPYPDAFAGLWFNNADGYTYAIVDPTPEILDKFEAMFGGGAWIVPAKYGENALRAAQDELFDEARAWCAAHPELDVQPVTASVNVVDGGYLEIGLSGADWREAAAGIDAEFAPPVWVMFYATEAPHFTAADASP